MAYSDPGAVTGGVTPVRGTWGNAVRDDLVDHETRILAVETGSTGVIARQTTLTNAQIKALPTTGIEIVPAPASGYRNKLLGLSFSTNTAAGAYTNINLTYSDIHADPGYVGYGIINDNSVSPDLDTLTNILGTAAQSVFDVPEPNTVATGILSDGLYVQKGSAVSRVSVEAIAITLKADNNGSGNFTGGNAANSMKVTVYYSVEAL
jgi:hypothetical protein